MRKTILDVCCGGKMFYFDKHDERVLFQDIRKISTHLCDGRLFEVNPDIQADFTNMPYEDKSFSMVVFDPPHLLRNVGKSKMADMYGKVFDDFFETQPIFCVCGKLATGIHERTCKKFNNKVEREVLRRLAHLLPYYLTRKKLRYGSKRNHGSGTQDAELPEESRR